MSDFFGQNGDALAVPATVEICRAPSVAAAVMPYTFFVNGKEIGVLDDGRMVTFTTTVAENTVSARDLAGNEGKPPFRFRVASGGRAHIVFRAGRFLPDDCVITAPPLDARAPWRALSPDEL